VHLLVNELCEYQNVQCNDKNYHGSVAEFIKFEYLGVLFNDAVN